MSRLGWKTPEEVFHARGIPTFLFKGASVKQAFIHSRYEHMRCVLSPSKDARIERMPEPFVDARQSRVSDVYVRHTSGLF